MLAGEGFDPPSFGLWVRHAPSAPPRYTMITLFFIYKALNYNFRLNKYLNN